MPGACHGYNGDQVVVRLWLALMEYGSGYRSATLSYALTWIGGAPQDDVRRQSRSSYKLPRILVWIIGVIILILMMAIAYGALRGKRSAYLMLRHISYLPFIVEAAISTKKRISFSWPYPSTISDGPVGIPAPSIPEKRSQTRMNGLLLYSKEDRWIQCGEKRDAVEQQQHVSCHYHQFWWKRPWD